MSDQPPLDPHDPFGVVFSPSPLKYEGGANEVPRNTESNADNPNLMNGMLSEELALLASAANPWYCPYVVCARSGLCT